MSNGQTFDLVVVGGGIAGLSAALRAAEQGLAVALLEKGSGERYPCNSRWSGGVLHIAFHSVKERPDALYEVILAATHGKADRALARALADDSGRAVDWLAQKGAKTIRMSAVDWQQHVLAPPRRIMAGLDWEGRGPDYTLRTMAQAFASRGGRFIGGARATGLMEREGACVGVEAEQGGARLQFSARAVLLADGGFQSNLDLVREHISPEPSKVLQRGAATGVGDGLRMAREAGAAVADLNHFYGHVLARDAFTNPKAWPYPQIDEMGMAGIAVDGAGRRFVDEGIGGVHLANAIARLPDPLSAWVIFDAAIWEGPGRDARIPANPHLLTAGVSLISAATVKELAAKTGLPAEALERTVAEYQAARAAGALAALQPPRTPAARPAWALDRPPLYAVPVCAGITYTFGGIVIDADGRVLEPGGEAITGLYAAGSATAGLEGRGGATYVGGLMKSLVFGLRVAEHVARSAA